MSQLPNILNLAVDDILFLQIPNGRVEELGGIQPVMVSRKRGPPPYVHNNHQFCSDLILFFILRDNNPDMTDISLSVCIQIPLAECGKIRLAFRRFCMFDEPWRLQLES